MFVATSEKNLHEIESLPLTCSLGSGAKQVPKFISKVHSIEIPQDTEFSSRSRSNSKSIPPFEDRVEININRLLDNLKVILDNQNNILKNHTKLLLYQQTKHQPIQYYLSKRLDKLSCRICCSTVTSILTLLGGITVLAITLTVLYQYMI